MAKPGGNWARPAWRAIGKALLVDGRGVLTAPEIAEVVDSHSSNVKRSAEEMVAAGLLEHRAAPTPAAGTTGRRPRTAYALRDGAEAPLREALADEHPLGAMRPAQHVVFADATNNVGELFHVLSQAPPLARASWYALLDGSPTEYVVAFDGEDAAQGAVDLMAVLDGARVPARRVSVAEVGSAERLADQSRSRARLAQRARLARGTREAS